MIEWSCPNCEIVVPMDEADFPVRCSCGYDSGNPEKISLAARAFSFTKAAISHVVRGSPTADQGEIDHRLGVCRRCEFFTGSTCLKCGCLVNSRRFLNKLAWADQECPIGRWEENPRFLPDWDGQPVDLVMIFPKSSNTLWVETRGIHVADFLRANGIRAVVALVKSSSPRKGWNYASILRDEIAKVIRLTRPGILINRAFLVDVGVVEQLAGDFPETTFVSVNHSSHAYTQSNEAWMSQQAGTIQLAQDQENVIFGHVDERDIFTRLGLQRCLWFPNVVTIPESSPVEVDLDAPLVSLVGRWHIVKNQLQQLMAMKLAGVRGLMIVKDKRGRQSAQSFAESIGLEVEFPPWGSWSDWNRLIGERIAVGLQASFSESFNYIALEHLIQGRPVVGSSAVRYLPASWKADPDSPDDIARVLRMHLDNYEEHSQEAREVADRVKRTNNQAILETLERIHKRRRL